LPARTRRDFKSINHFQDWLDEVAGDRLSRQKAFRGSNWAALYDAAYQALIRDAHALARQLWDVCVDVATEMQKEAQRGRAQTVFDDRYWHALNARLDAIDTAAKAEPALRFNREVFWFSCALTHFLYSSRFRAVWSAVHHCPENRAGWTPDRADGDLGAAFRCIGRCLNESCRHWFFARDDRQMYCASACRESRQPARRRAAVASHRTRKRA
jgi:hypothetical protein